MSSQKPEFTGCIGIDLGTTFSCVGVWQGDRVEIIPNDLGNRTTPSWVAFSDTERLVGEGAKNQATMNPTNTLFDVKRIIGKRFSEDAVQADIAHFPFEITADENDLPLIKVQYKDAEKKFKPEEISAMVLMKMKSVAEAYLGTTVKNAVVTVPAYFNDYQRQATRDAATIAGLKCLRIINEPTAACLCYGLDKKLDGVNVLIYDCGGGTTDVSVLHLTGGIFEVIATSGNTHLGGEDFDHALMKWVLEEFANKYPNIEGNPAKSGKAMRKLKAACEKAKRTLSASASTLIDVDAFWGGIDLSLKVSRAKFEEVAANVLRQCMDPVERVLGDADLTPDEIDEIVLIGGSTRIPKIQELLSRHFNGKTLNKSVNPDEAVAFGAAVQGAILTNSDTSGKTKDLVLIDVLPLSLGLETTGGIMTKLIERNSSVPISNSQIFSTVEDNQASVLVQVYEGERKFTKDNNQLGTFELTEIPKMPRGVPKIEVTFDVDVNGILNVTAIEQSTGKSSEVTINRESGRLTQEEINQMVEDAEVYRGEDELRKQALDARNAFERYLYSVQSSVNDENINDNLTEEEISWVNQYLINTFTWLTENEEANKEIIDRSRQQVEYNLKPYLYKVYSRQEEVRQVQQVGDQKADKEKIQNLIDGMFDDEEKNTEPVQMKEKIIKQVQQPQQQTPQQQQQTPQQQQHHAQKQHTRQTPQQQQHHAQKQHTRQAPQQQQHTQQAPQQQQHTQQAPQHPRHHAQQSQQHQVQQQQPGQHQVQQRTQLTPEQQQALMRQRLAQMTPEQRQTFIYQQKLRMQQQKQQQARYQQKLRIQQQLQQMTPAQQQVYLHKIRMQRQQQAYHRQQSPPPVQETMRKPQKKPLATPANGARAVKQRINN